MEGKTSGKTEAQTAKTKRVPPFAAPHRDVLNAAIILSAAADITLIVDASGIICDKVIADHAFEHLFVEGWKGKRLTSVVTSECKPKVERMLAGSTSGGALSWSQLNHYSPKGPDIPVRYMPIPSGKDGHVILIGRQLADLARNQQRLVAAEHAYEIEQSRARQTRSWLRSAFSSSSEAVLVVEPETGRVLDANPAAFAHLDVSSKQLIGSAVSTLLNAADRQTLRDFLLGFGKSNESRTIELSPKGASRPLAVHGSVFRRSGKSFVLLRLTRADQHTAPGPSAAMRALLEMREGFVLTDFDQNVIAANPSFLTFGGLEDDRTARGHSIGNWLGRDRNDCDALFGEITRDGGARGFRTIVRDGAGRIREVEVEGVKVDEPGTPCIALILRPLSAVELELDARRRELSHIQGQTQRLIGQATLKDLASEAAERIERTCIEAALASNAGNRTAAAAWLGLSRQSLYVKLDHYGLGRGPDEPEG